MEETMNCKYYKCDKPTRSAKSDICRTHYHYEWRKANPDKLRAQQKRYQEKHADRITAYRKEYNKKNKESINKNAKEFMARNAKNPVTQEHMTDSVKERFFAKVQKTDTCWNWTGAKTAYRPKRLVVDATPGYGVISINSRPFYAHRASWLMHKGPLVDGLVIDHLCENTLCVNPDHMQQVTNNENSQRSPRHTINGAKYSYHKELCKRGHKRGIEMKGKPCSQCQRERYLRQKQA
jgi:hypothetical protein